MPLTPPGLGFEGLHTGGVAVRPQFCASSTGNFKEEPVLGNLDLRAVILGHIHPIAAGHKSCKP